MSPRGRRLWRACLVGSCLGGATAGAWYLYRTPAQDPPVLHAQDGADPEFVQALEEARRAVLEDRGSSERWGELGMVFAAHGAEAEANTCFSAAQEREPDNPRWPYYLALFSSVHHPDQAEHHFRRALELEPRDPQIRAAARARLAELLVGQNRLDEASELFELSSGPRGQLGLARIAMLRGDTADAQARFKKLVGDPFANQQALIQLAALALQNSQAEDATRYQEQARTAPADLPWVDPWLADLHRRSVGRQNQLREADKLTAAGRLAEATRILIDVAEADPNPRSLTSVAINLMKMGQHRQAEELLRRCVRQQPGQSQAEYFLAVTLFQRAEAIRSSDPAQAKVLLREAIEHGRAAVEAKPDLGLAWLYVGRAILELDEDRNAAIAALRQAVTCRPEFVDTHLYLAEALLAAGQKEEATREAKNAEELAATGDTRPRQLLQKIGKP